MTTADQIISSIKSLITTRGVQLIARWICKGLVALGAVEITTHTKVVEVVATAAAAGLCVLVDLLSHRYQAAIQSQVVEELVNKIDLEAATPLTTQLVQQMPAAQVAALPGELIRN